MSLRVFLCSETQQKMYREAILTKNTINNLDVTSSDFRSMRKLYREAILTKNTINNLDVTSSDFRSMRQLYREAILTKNIINNPNVTSSMFCVGQRNKKCIEKPYSLKTQLTT